MIEKTLDIIKLASNENALGTSPLALEAIKDNYHNVHRYPEYHPFTLKDILAGKHNVLSQNIALSAGSVGMIDMIIKNFVNYDEEVLTFENSFVAYGLLAKANKKKCSFAKLTDFTCDVNNLFPLPGEKTKVIFIANPNNPTGTIISHDSLYRLLKAISSEILVIIDEAYYEYVTDVTYPDSLKLQKEFPNLIILHSFSKIYGLAGLRIGYAIAHEGIVQEVEERSMPYRINSLASAAACAALDDHEFIEKCAIFNNEERNFLYHELANLGYNVVPSQGNFIYMYFDQHESKERVFKQLSDEGILICNMDIFGQEKSLRITIGRSEVNRRIIECLRK
ncbi:MAG: histidinol-phosphate transaminase [Bacteroidota bacterium]